MSERTEKNLELWRSVEKTDPAYTKRYKGRGGFQGTAICAQWQRKKATELWGPYGGAWGLRNEIFERYPENSLVYHAEFFYPGGAFGIHVDGLLQTNDAYKKVATDGLTKSLSMLGFSADIFMGLFDDNSYVEEVGAEFGAEKAAEAQEQDKVRKAREATVAEEREQRIADWKAKIEESDSVDSMRQQLREARNTLFRDDWTVLVQWSKTKAEKFNKPEEQK